MRVGGIGPLKKLRAAGSPHDIAVADRHGLELHPEWHRSRRMPVRATFEQRLEWHVEPPAFRRDEGMTLRTGGLPREFPDIVGGVG